MTEHELARIAELTAQIDAHDAQIAPLIAERKELLGKKKAEKAAIEAEKVAERKRLAEEYRALRVVVLRWRDGFEPAVIGRRHPSYAETYATAVAAMPRVLAAGVSHPKYKYAAKLQKLLAA